MIHSLMLCGLDHCDIAITSRKASKDISYTGMGMVGRYGMKNETDEWMHGMKLWYSYKDMRRMNERMQIYK